MLLGRRYGTFTGGIDLPDEKDATLGRPIVTCPPIARLRVPLAPCGGAPAESLVAPGQRVRAGQKIARAADASGVDIFAPLDGTVASLTTAATAGRYGLVVSSAIELTDLAAPQRLQSIEQNFEWSGADTVLLRMRIAEGGLTVHRRGCEPLEGWIARGRTKGVGALIANLMESQPFVTADHQLMVEHGLGVVHGLALLARAMEVSRVFLAADQRRTEDYRRALAPARMHQIQTVALPAKYPIGADAILTKILTRRETPPGGEPMDVGAAVVDAATCLAAYRWVACGDPPIGRVVTLSGQRVRKPDNIFVPFGVSCVELVGDAEPPVVHGGPMTGLRCTDDVVVSPSTDAVLALEAVVPPVPGPCIRCGWCTDHCPARLNVSALNDAFELWHIPRAAGQGVRACVDCGVCSYVCPACLPLSQRMKQLKREVGRRAAMPGSEASV